jgi:hypothetical protein
MRLPKYAVLCVVLAVLAGALVLVSDRPLDAQVTLVAQESTSRAMLATLRSVDASLQAMRLALRLPLAGPAGLPRPVDVTVRSMPSTDLCAGDLGKGNVAVSQTASTRLVQGVPGTLIRVCYAAIVAGAAEIVSLTEGTGTTCATGAAAVTGSTTAANGESYAANGGISRGNGAGTVALTIKRGDDLCLAQNTSSRVSGNVVYVQAP